MSINFTKLSEITIGLTDKIPYGIYKDCRAIDVAKVEYDYILYIQSKTKLFSKEVVDEAKRQKEKIEEAIHYENEIKPYLTDDFEDVPF